MDNNKIIEFWNSQFSKVEKYVFKQSDFVCESSLDKMLKFIGDNCSSVLDFGCGLGFCLFEAKAFGSKMEKGLGIDSSIEAINYCNAAKKNFPTLEFIQDDGSNLKNIKENQFDGIVCSNVLDVIPEDVSTPIINEFIRILPEKGYLLLKVNFYLTEELAVKCNLENKHDNYYYHNDILRGVNLTKEEWENKFKPLKLVKFDYFVRVPNGPQDRVFLFQKV